MSLCMLMQLWREVGERLRDERKRGESLIDCLNRVIAEAQKWRNYGASKPQPAPQNQGGPPLWPMIIRELGDSELNRLLAADMSQRHEFGVAKYGVPLVASNGRDHLRDAYEEALDLTAYTRAVYESKKGSNLWKDHGLLIHKQIHTEAKDMALRLRELILVRDGK